MMMMLYRLVYSKQPVTSNTRDDADFFLDFFIKLINVVLYGEMKAFKMIFKVLPGVAKQINLII